MHRKTTVSITALATAAMFVLASCASASPEPSATGDEECAMPSSMATATVATNPGAQDMVMKHVKAEGFDTKYNLDLQIQEFQNPPATAQAIVQKAVNFGFGGLTTMVQARDQGADVIMIGTLSTPNNGVFVREDSDIEDLDDLHGKKVGSFSGLNGAITSIMQAYAQSAYDLNMLEDVDGEVHVAPDAALVGLLDQGQLDAVILGVDATGVQQYLGDYRQIVNLTTDFPDEFGFDALYLGPVTTEEYASAHCGEVRAYVSAIRDAILDIQQNPAVWDAYVEAIGQPADAAETFQNLYANGFRTAWGEEQVDGMKQLVETLTPYLDPTFPDEVDPGLFSLDYPAFDEE